MLEAIWVGMITMALVCGVMNNALDAVAQATGESATQAVTLSIRLLGVTCWWLGLLEMVRRGGLLDYIAANLRPVMTWLFPEVPVAHPAMSAMILNMTANILGLGNVATPFGLQAMVELNKLNPRKGQATAAMVTFLAINTSGLAIIPTGMIALRTSLGAHLPGTIVLPTLLSTLAAAICGVAVAKMLHRREQLLPNFQQISVFQPAAAAALPDVEYSQPTQRSRQLGWGLALVFAIAFTIALQKVWLHAGAPMGWAAFSQLQRALSSWVLLILLAIMLSFAVGRNVRIYDAVVAGARDGMPLVGRVVPYLIAMLVVVGMLRASGSIDMLTQFFAPITNFLGIPPEVLPMALLRPLSGQGAFAMAAELMQKYGPDSLIGNIAATLMGTTETTFYVLALYLGVVNIGQSGKVLLACLAADLGGTLSAVWSCRLLGQ